MFLVQIGLGSTDLDTYQAKVWRGNKVSALKAYTDKNKVIDTIGDHVGGENRPALFASSSRRTRQLPTPPRQKLRGSIGSSYFGCARCDLRSKDRSRRMLQTPQYKPNGSTRVGEGLSGGRGRVLSQSLLVARERRRRELGSNLVIVTTTLTSGEGHVVEIGVSQRVRKICAGVPASVSIRDQILTLSFSRSQRQYWTVGNRPIRKNDLRSLHRNSVEAQIQDRSRQKTGLNTVPGFSRVYTSFPRTREPRKKQSTPLPPLRFAKGDASAASRGMPEIHRSYLSTNNVSPPPSFPRTTPSFPRTREPREKQSTPFTPPPAIPRSNRLRLRLVTFKIRGCDVWGYGVCCSQISRFSWLKPQKYLGRRRKRTSMLLSCRISPGRFGRMCNGFSLVRVMR